MGKAYEMDQETTPKTRHKRSKKEHNVGVEHFSLLWCWVCSQRHFFTNKLLQYTSHGQSSSILGDCNSSNTLYME